MSIAQKVIRFAHIAHSGQVRKYTNLIPYIQHPLAVASLIRENVEFLSNTMIHAAILHDTVEDTEVTLDDIELFFGPVVKGLVYWVTDKSKPEDGNRAARKAIDRAHIACAPGRAQTIKLADLIDNAGSIQKYDSDFAKVYMMEKKLLLPLLTKGDSLLWDKANEIVANYYNKLNQD